MSKAYPEEKVGVFAQHGSQNMVVEYSELDPDEASATDESETAAMSGLLLTTYNESRLAIEIQAHPAKISFLAISLKTSSTLKQE